MEVDNVLAELIKCVVKEIVKAHTCYLRSRPDLELAAALLNKFSMVDSESES